MKTNAWRLIEFNYGIFNNNNYDGLYNFNIYRHDQDIVLGW